METKLLALLVLFSSTDYGNYKFNKHSLELELHIKVRSLYAAHSIELVSYLSQGGLHGEIHFMESTNDRKLVKVRTFLETTLQYPDQSWTWGVHQNPIDYSIIDPVERCNNDHTGPQLLSFDDVLGYLIMPGNESSTWNDAKLSLNGKCLSYFCY